jgi:hypothetical protein
MLQHITMADLVSFKFNDYAEDKYLCGECGVLALVLNEITKYPIFGVYSSNYTIPEIQQRVLKGQDDAETSPIHYVIQLPNDKYVDILGIWSELKLKEWWQTDESGTPYMNRFTHLQPVDQFLSCPSYYEQMIPDKYDYFIARQIQKLI